MATWLDSDDDGTGDLAGLTRRLDYLWGLGVTPVLLYGDEIGMGEDLSLPGRLAVRNPIPLVAMAVAMSCAIDTRQSALSKMICIAPVMSSLSSTMST